MPRHSKRSRGEEESEEEVEEHDNFGDGHAEEEDDAPHNQSLFSQVIPEMSQGVQAEKPSDRRNLENMDKKRRDKAVSSLSRLLLFKALEREPIDRLKIIKEAGLGKARISSALFQEASHRLKNVFGFELKRAPKYMMERKSLPSRFKDRYYIQNSASDNDAGNHSQAIHAVHESSAIERGLLMLINGLIFCKGESRSDGSRWILARDLYRLLNQVDESIPEEPPAQGTARAKAHTKTSRFGENMTPNVDALLELFCHWDYFIKEKASDENCSSQTLEEGDMLYTMGPRSALEIGRKQVIFFCAQVLDVEPDMTMLKEVEDDIEDVEEEKEVFMEDTAE
jgi:hypothetical protein